MTEDIIKKLINKGYSITLYENALGTITAKAESAASELVLPPENSLNILKGTPWGEKESKGQGVKLVSEIITDGRNIEEALRRLEQKVE